MDQHVLRELSLAVDNRGGTIGEFVVELYIQLRKVEFPVELELVYKTFSRGS